MKTNSKQPSLFSGKKENHSSIVETIIQNSNNIIYEHDTKGYFSFISPQIKDILGYSPEELKIKWLDMLTDNPANEIGIRSTQKAIETSERQPPYELELLAKNGTKHWFEIREAPFLKNGKTATIIGTCIDITDRKLYEEKLKLSEEKYRLLVENQNEMIAKFDLKGCLTYVSPNYCTNFNVKHKDIIGRRFIPEVHEADKNEFQKVLDKSLSEPYDIYHEERMMTIEGWRWFGWSNKAIRSENGSVNEIVSIGRDISLQKETEDKLRISEQSLKEAQSIGKIGSWEWDINSDKAIWSDQSYILVGAEPNEFEPSLDTFLNFVIDEDKHVVNAALKKALKGEDSNYDCRIIRKDGKERVLNIQYMTFYDHDHKPVRIAGTHEDITERKTAEEELRKSEETSLALLNSFIDSAILLDVSGNVIALNERSAKHYNKSKEELIGVNLFELMSKDIADQRKQRLAEAAKLGRPIRFEDQRIGIWFDNIVCPIFDEYDNIYRYAVYASDITERKKTEDSLKLSEEKFSKAFFNSPNAITLSSLKDGKILDINDFGAKALGYKKEEVIGNTSIELEIVNNEDRDRIFDELKTHGSYSDLELTVKTKSGEERIGLFYGQPISIGGENYLFQTITDITQIKIAEEEIQKLALIVKETDNGIIITDINEKTEWINEGFTRITGYNATDVIGKEPSEIMFDDETDEQTLNQLINAINKQISEEVELQIRCKDRKRKWVQINVQPVFDEQNDLVRFIGIVLDINQRKLAEVAVTEQHNIMRTMIDALPMNIYVKDKDHKFILVNETLAKFHNFASPDELIGKTDFDLFSLEDAERYKAIERELMELNEDYVDKVDLIEDENGNKDWWNNTKIPLRNQEGLSTGFVGIHKNITEIMKTEEEVQKLALIAKETDNAVIIAGLDRNIEWVNIAFTQLTGYEINEVLGKNPINLLGGEETDSETINRIINATNNGINIREELINYSKDKRKYWVEISIQPILDNSGEIVKYFSILYDITERKKAEEEISKLALIAKETNNGVIITDRNKHIDWVNEGFSKITGYSLDDVIGKEPKDLLFGVDTAKKDLILIGEKLKNKKSIEVEILIYTKDGNSKWAQINIKPIFNEQNNLVRFIGIVLDINQRKEAEEALRKSEEQYRTIFNSTSNSLVIFNSDLAIIDANPAACEMYQYTLEEMKSLNLRDIKTPEMIERHLPTLNGLLMESSWKEFESTDIRKNGKKFWTDVRLHIFNFNNKKYFLDIATDITERKIAERKLKYSEEKFSKAFLASPDSVTLSSLVDGRLVEINKGFENIFGYSRDEAIGKSTIELELYKNPIDRDNVVSILKSEGNVRDYEAEYNTKNGKSGIAEISMELIHIGEENFLLTIVRNITERKRFEEDLSASEEKFSGAFHSSMDAYAITRFGDGVIIEINEVFIKMFEGNREEIIGKTTLELGLYKNKKDRERVIEELNRNDAVENMEAEYVTKNNNIGWAQFSINKIKISSKLYLFTSIRDITEQKRVETEIEEYQENLKSLASELTLAEEKERRRIAINLHDHLSQSLAMSKIRLAEAEKEDLSANSLEKIRDAKNFLDTAINNSRSITYDLSPPVLYDLGFSAAVRWRLDQVEKDHKITTELVDNVETMILKADVRVLLFSAAIEIINNVVKHSKATKVTVIIDKDSEYLYVRITDNGIGFDPGVAEKEATKKRSFGLFSIRERISFLHGKMEIDSIIGNGTTIKIKIPYDLTI
jgi:PAS domain S-box-containing protein